MKHYLELIPISAKVQRKRSRMTQLCILLAVFLITAIFSMADMEIRAQKIQTIYDYGNWHAAFRQLDQQQAALIAARADVDVAAPYQVRNYRLDEAYQIQDIPVAICGFPEEFLQMFPAGAISEGSFCTAPDSAVLTESAKTRLGLSIGDVIQLTLPDGQSLPLTVSGFSPTTALLNQSDAIGLYLNLETYQKLPDVHAEDTSLYVRFVPFCNIQKTLQTVAEQFQLSDAQISENAQLLALSLQSGDSYMIRLYCTAAVLAVLVMTAGIFMIASSLNSNVAQRTQFFGLLRCLGATPKQVVHFVRCEALVWCRTALPLGIAAAILVSWMLCALLRFLSPNLFADMPKFAISWPSVLIGALAGMVTVLWAAHAPAKRAALVSPLTAVSGNAQRPAAVRSAANDKFFPIHVALGIQHATASRKNFFLIVTSFAFSIILFLAFSTTVDFMQHAITPLRPYTADLSISSSICSADSACSIPAQLSEQLRQEPSVKRVYGRSLARQLPVQINGKTQHIDLLSYDAQQLSWAERELLSGTLSGVARGSGLLLVHDSNTLCRENDTVTFLNTDYSVTLPIQAVVSTCPLQQESEVDTLICSEALFQQLTGQEGYTFLDLQLNSQADDDTVAQIRAHIEPSLQFSDRRLRNSEAKGAYYAMALFIYGFLVIIALISVFNIINTMAMSVSARLQQYGAMRAIGMSDHQVFGMITAETAAYTIWGILAGCVIGLPVNRFLFTSMITSRWGDSWTVPTASLLCILVTVLIAAVLAIWNPVRQIRQQSIVETIQAI